VLNICVQKSCSENVDEIDTWGSKVWADLAGLIGSGTSWLVSADLDREELVGWSDTGSEDEVTNPEKYLKNSLIKLPEDHHLT
jgi:hypothetical protein